MGLMLFLKSLLLSTATVAFIWAYYFNALFVCLFQLRDVFFVSHLVHCCNYGKIGSECSKQINYFEMSHPYSEKAM